MDGYAVSLTSPTNLIPTLDIRAMLLHTTHHVLQNNWERVRIYLSAFKWASLWGFVRLVSSSHFCMGSATCALVHCCAHPYADVRSSQELRIVYVCVPGTDSVHAFLSLMVFARCPAFGFTRSRVSFLWKLMCTFVRSWIRTYEHTKTLPYIFLFYLYDVRFVCVDFRACSCTLFTF